ncbi:MAG: helicase-associated domain-containing protein [Polyangiales bacterium]
MSAAGARASLPIVLGASHLEAPVTPTIGDAATMSRRAAFWAGKAPPGGKAAHQQVALEAMADPQRIRDGIARRSPLDRIILGVVARYGGGVSEAIVEREIALRSPERPKVADSGPRRIGAATARPIDGLVAVGLIDRVGGREHSYSYVYGSEEPRSTLLAPTSIRPHLPSIGPVAWPTPPVARSAPHVTIERDPNDAIAELREVARVLASGGPWRVTNARLPHAVVLSRVSKALPNLARDDASGLPNRAAFAYVMLDALGVFARHDDGALRASVKPRRLDAVFTGDPLNDVAALVTAWIAIRGWDEVTGTLAAPEDFLDIAGQARERSHNAWRLGALAHAGEVGAGWIDTGSFLDQIGAHEAPPDPSGYRRRTVLSAESLRAAHAALQTSPTGRVRWDLATACVLVASLTRTLVHLGLVARSAEPKGLECFRLTPIGRAFFGSPERAGSTEHAPAARAIAASVKCLVVQPNDDVLLYVADAGPKTRATLLRYCERTTFVGQIHTFKITAATVRGAIESGDTAEAIVEFFETHSRHAVPDRVKISIREWGDPSRVLRWIPAANVSVDSQTGTLRIDPCAPKRVIRVLGTPRPDSEARVSDGGRITLPTDLSSVSWVTRARMLRLSHASGAGARGTVEINRATVERLLADGISPQRLVQIAEAMTGARLPALLATSLENWGGARTAITTTPVVLLESPNARALEALRTSPRFQALGVRSSGANVWVSSDRLDEIVDALTELGFALPDLVDADAMTIEAPPVRAGKKKGGSGAAKLKR